jgi:hypothetical protein
MADEFIFVEGTYYNVNALKSLGKVEFKKQLGHLKSWEDAYNKINKGSKKKSTKKVKPKSE